MGTSPYGPFDFRGSVVDPAFIDASFQDSRPLIDRHGSFFQWHNQWYYACNDFSQSNSSDYFRDTIVTYVHYYDNGAIAPVKINGVGVGEYDVALGVVEMEEFFSLDGPASKREGPGGGFQVCLTGDNVTLSFPNVAVAKTSTMVQLAATNAAATLPFTVVVDGVPSACVLQPIGDALSNCTLTTPVSGSLSVQFLFTTGATHGVCLDWFTLTDQH
mmetsp:Transcript_25198/g.59457  ORF Transcript_25198/g.59457 Transcript_25198/m.59457 type:complete len:216 (+) Transcript_25198:262-909(+)